MANPNHWDPKRRVKEFSYSGSEDEEIVKIFESYRKKGSVIVPKKTKNSLHITAFKNVRIPSSSIRSRNNNVLANGIPIEDDQIAAITKKVQEAKKCFNNGNKCRKLFEMNDQKKEASGGGDGYGYKVGFEKEINYFEKKSEQDKVVRSNIMDAPTLTKWQNEPGLPNTEQLLKRLRNNERSAKLEKPEKCMMQTNQRMSNMQLRNILHNIRKGYNTKETTKNTEIPERSEKLNCVDRSMPVKRPATYERVEDGGIPMKIKRQLEKLEENERLLRIKRQLKRERQKEKERLMEVEKQLERERRKACEKQMKKENFSKHEEPRKEEKLPKAERLFQLEIWEKPPEPPRNETTEWKKVKGEYPWKYMDDIRKDRTSHVTLWKPKIFQNEPPAKWQLAGVEEKATMSRDVEPKIKFRSTSQTPITSKARACESAIKAKGVQLRSRTFSNERVREIERHNKILLKKILTPKTSIPEKARKPKAPPPPKKATKATMNRIKKQQQIDKKNFELKKRIKAISVRKPIN